VLAAGRQPGRGAARRRPGAPHVIISVYALSGLLAGSPGCSRRRASAPATPPRSGLNIELDAIAARSSGGTALTGRPRDDRRHRVGALVMQVIATSFNMLLVPVRLVARAQGRDHPVRRLRSSARARLSARHAAREPRSRRHRSPLRRPRRRPRARALGALRERRARSSRSSWRSSSAPRATRVRDAREPVNVLRQNSMVGLVALGMTFVILTGGIDLSVGAVLAVAGVVAAALSPQGTLVALAGGLAAAAVLGIVNGLLVTRARISRSSSRWR
jgi:ribose/xylose/arabinose/galactoside ABC-type transport system permease subunit